METRPFGNTGESLPILGMGTQRIVDEHDCSEQDALQIINAALDWGIRYFDTAWVYSRGQAEKRLGKVAKHRRKEMWIATKTYDASRAGARLQLEESLTRLQTDYVDEWRFHDVYDYGRLDEFTGKDGALETAVRAREEGLIRYISISGHTNPQVLVKAMGIFPFDSFLIPASVLDHFILSFVDEFLPTANKNGAAVIGMKVLGLGSLKHETVRSLRYAFSLPLSMVIVGLETISQLTQNLAVAESFVPMTTEERFNFFKDIKSLVGPEKMPWKSNNWAKPRRWVSRKRNLDTKGHRSGLFKLFLHQLGGAAEQKYW